MTALIFLTTRGDSVEWLTSSPGVRRPRLAFLGRWMWPVKRQLLRVKNVVVGVPKLVNVRGVLLEFDSPRALVDLSGVISKSTNHAGEQVWIVTDGSTFSESLKTLPGAKVISVPGTIMREDNQSQMQMVNSVAVGASTNLHLEYVGWWLDAWISRGRDESLELTSFLTWSERVLHRGTPPDVEGTTGYFIHTNAAFGGRVRVPKDGGLLLISSKTNQHGKTAAAILVPSVPGGRR
ncbi:MAG TPA: hypothetical protein VK846_05560 [Candidatus Limnocylindria bacterium]|nr:hypothetical protein [Candidatus Limnocylindria bacterium]